jgi:beta-lactamase class A
MRAITLLLVVMLSTSVARPMMSSADAVQRRLDDVCAMLSGKPLVYDTIFSEQFLRQVPAIQLTTIAQQMTRQTGPCTGIRIVERASAYQVRAEAATQQGFVIPVLLTVAAAPPYRIEGLFLRPPVKPQRTVADVVSAFRSLSGRISLTIKDLANGGVIAAVDTSAVLPMGSTFKLYVLGELLRVVRRGERRWTDVVSLDTVWRSLPSGRLHTWPHGSPLTLHTLASMMISESDNTATDALIRLLGPDMISRHQTAMGHGQAYLNRPFLTTLQAFKLKYADTAMARAYEVAIPSERQAIVDRLDNTISHASIQPGAGIVFVETIEWFATTSELCRAMDWFRLDAERTGDDTALRILGINSGVPVSAAWRHHCYKGGSEPGMINMTYLLQHASGTWYACSVTWMDGDNGVDEAKFAGLVEQAIQVLHQ